MSLPNGIDLDQYKAQAKDLMKAARAADPQAIERIRAHHPEHDHLAASNHLRLADTQLVIARENGYPSWPKLKSAILSVQPAGYTRIINPDFAHNEERAKALLEQHKDALPYVIAQIKRRHPRFARVKAMEIRKATLTEDDARLIYARDHGFEDWHALTAHLEALRNGAAEEPFAVAFAAIKAGDLGQLRALLAAHPDLISARGTNDNTLLNLAVGNKAPEAARMLIAAGADVNLPNNRGWTALHAAGYGNWAELVDPLVQAGARIDLNARGDGGTPLVIALFWGHREVAEALARYGVVPLNLRVAAGLGQLDLVQSFFEPDGTLKPSAGEHRGFYRPHSGFPYWQPSDSRQEILDEAFVYACKSDRVEVLGYLITMGANIDGDPYRGTGLTWAGANGRVRTIDWLLDHGAGIDHRGTFGGLSHGGGVTALHLAAGSGRLEAAKLLIERGASITLRDELYGGSAMGWAAFWGHKSVRDFLGTICPIEDAAQFGYIERVKELLSENPELVHGSDRDRPNSALLRAVWGNQPAIVQLLLDHGADPNTPNKEGKTALEIALAQGSNDIAQILRGHGARESRKD